MIARTLAILTMCVLPVLTSSRFPAVAQNARKDDLSPERVRAAIKNGVDYLRNRQKSGHWENQVIGFNGYTGGVTSLVMLALIESGVPVDDPVIQNGLNYLRNQKLSDTYAVALQTMVLSHAEPDKDRVQIKANVDWLRRTVKRGAGGALLGFGYPERLPGVDQSNTQYAVLALREAGVAGVAIDDQLWREIQQFYLDSQKPNGGWSYRMENPLEPDRLTMTCAGVCGLLITGMQLYRNDEKILNDGTIENCGKFAKNDPLDKGLKRLAETFTVNYAHFRFYNLYGIERAGRLSGQRFFTSEGKTIDWYRAGARYLVDSQLQVEGCWRGDNAIDGHPLVATPFALLFLAKGKTPVLIHKLRHGRLDERALVGDWNNDRNDVRNITEYCSQKIFLKNGRPVPLTWQVFDGAQASVVANREGTDPVAEMLQAPIVYFNGHLKPYFSDGEKKLLKEYVEQGGFIFAEACCGRKEFTDGFRQLVAEIWGKEGKNLEPLQPGHPIWESAFRIPPGSFKLEGIDFGCKTCVVFAPEDISCHWESNRFTGPEGDRTLLAFRTGANVIAYATGLEPPQDKLTAKQLSTKEESPIVRNYLQVAQVNYGGRDWQPAPNAMRNVMGYLNKNWNLDVIMQTKPIGLGDGDLVNQKFLYMHGRNEFTLAEDFQNNLRKHLQNGGMLLADACCGSKEFDKSFRKMIVDVFKRDLEPISLKDPLFGERIGKKIETVQGRTQRGTPYAAMAPQFEGIRLDPANPRSPWIVVYSKYDLGCALEKQSSIDCLGYSPESALELAAQVVLYALKE